MLQSRSKADLQLRQPDVLRFIVHLPNLVGLSEQGLPSLIVPQRQADIPQIPVHDLHLWMVLLKMLEPYSVGPLQQLPGCLVLALAAEDLGLVYQHLAYFY